MQSTTLRPGLLVSLNTSVRGNVEYYKQDIDAAYRSNDGTVRAKWETEKVIRDPAEYEAAIKIRGKIRSLISGICAKSAFGLLCRQDRKDDLEAAIAEGQQMARDFNRTARLTAVSAYVVTGIIAQDDAQAVQAINSEIRELLQNMEAGVRQLDVESIRDAANRAKNLAAMLTPEAAARVQVAIDAVRTTARQLVKAGETASVEIDARAIRAITESRTAFLDLDDNGQEMAAPVVSGRALDLDPTSTLESLPAAPQRSLELF
jgi:hypothetical protein